VYTVKCDRTQSGQQAVTANSDFGRDPFPSSKRHRMYNLVCTPVSLSVLCLTPGIKITEIRRNFCKNLYEMSRHFKPLNLHNFLHDIRGADVTSNWERD
jgi:hypothetical protein